MAENVSKKERKKRKKIFASTFWTEQKDKGTTFRENEKEKMIDRKAWTSNGKSKEKILFGKPRRQKKKKRMNKFIIDCTFSAGDI